jgi:asparagine synthase (glutamine-hydrolysing)
MCGISGIIRFHPHSGEFGNEEKKNLESSLQAIHHRGPDSQHLIEKKRVLLGHVRLSIIDLTSKADQPMCDSSGRYSLVYNGEIFNFKILKKALEKEEIVFNSESDTEVLLQLLIKKGSAALDELNGFFAFAFYDSFKDELILARDRFGVKPLWYYQDQSNFYFSSELKGLMKFPIPKKINPLALASYFKFSFIPAPESIYRDVRKLMPGHLIRIGKSTIEEKWYPDTCIPFDQNSGNNPISQFRELLDDAVKIRLEADVALGSLLSGGLDSSVLTMLAAKHKNSLESFCVSFPDEPFFDESKYAEIVARKVGTKLHLIPLRSHQLAYHVLDVWDSLDEPFADSSAIAYSKLCAEVKNSVTVAISGDGADELLGGYYRQLAFKKSFEDKSAYSILHLFQPLLNIIPQSRNSATSNKARQLDRFLNGIKMPVDKRYLYWSSFGDDNRINQLLDKSDLAQINFAEITKDIHDGDLNSILKTDQKLLLINDMLVKSDLMGMKNAMEIRTPFLDFRVVQLVNSLPVEYKIRDSKTKWLLREAFAKDLPSEIMDRSKRGFEVPLETWLRGSLKDVVLQLLHPSKMSAHPLLNARGVEELLRDFYGKNQGELTYLLYSLALFQHWFERQLLDTN